MNSDPDLLFLVGTSAGNALSLLGLDWRDAELWSCDEFLSVGKGSLIMDDMVGFRRLKYFAIC